MSGGPRIAIDAMGGDAGPKAMIAGASHALRKDPTLEFTFYGDEVRVAAEIGAHRNLAGRSQLVHSPEAIAASEKPSQAIRRARTTSMGMAINAVKEGVADAALSGGNTGAMMAMSKLALRTMPGIDRPALAALLPTLGDNDVIMLDLGANTECDAQNLVQFAVMGAAYSRTVLGIAAPRVKLLNIGTEELKGTDELKDAAALLREADYLPFRFDGFTEGDQLSRGAVDVVVTDGFSGNIALKTAEGTAKLVGQFLRRSLKRSLLGQIGAFIASGALGVLRRRLDPRAANGGIFLGLKGVVVKSHGGTDAIGFASALDMAISVVKADINTRIVAERARLTALVPA